jgi:hypothetical protein
MKGLSFILATASALQAVKDLVSTDGVSINGEVWTSKNRPSNKQIETRLGNASEEDIQAILEACDFDESDVAQGAVGADEVVIDLDNETMSTVKTTDGKDIDVVLAEYVGQSANGFKFMLKSGIYIIVTGDKMFQLFKAGGLTDGYQMPFKPESVRPTEHLGYYNGIPNFSADERLTKVLEANATNQKILRASIAEIRALKLPRSVQNERINKLVDSVIETPKLVKLKF